MSETFFYKKKREMGMCSNVCFLKYFWKTVDKNLIFSINLSFFFSAKMNLISNINLQQINDKINQINNKLEQKNNDYNKISNMMQNHYKPFDTSLIIDRIKVLEDGLKSLTSKLDSLNNVEAKINNLKSDINEININSRLLKSQLLPGLIGVEKTEFLTQIDALGYQLNAMNQVQNDIKAKLESCTNIHTRTNTLNKSIPNSDSKQTMPKPPLELISPSSSMETVLYQFLETANIAADDSLSPQSVVNDDKNDKRRSRPQGINNNNRQSQTFGLLKQLWKKFTRPIYNLSRSFEDLKKNGLKDSGLCEKSVTQFNKLQTMIVSHFDTLSQSFRPSFNFCENIMKKLESLSINSDAQFNNLDQRMFYHISLSEKMYDKLSNSVFLTNEASVDKSFSDVKASDCAELQELGADINGIHTIYINNREKEVYCDFTSHGGGWTVSSTFSTLLFLKLNFDYYMV